MSKQFEDLSDSDFATVRDRRIGMLNRVVLASAVLIMLGVLFGPEPVQPVLRALAGILFVGFGVWFWRTIRPLMAEERRRAAQRSSA